VPSTAKIMKEEIIAAAYEITKEQGIEAATARAVAKRLRCSVQPVYYIFETMENMREAVFVKAKQKYAQILLAEIPGMPLIQAIGYNYMRFAKEYPHLFRLLFTTDRHENASVFDDVIDDNKPYVMRLIMEDCGIKDEKRAEDIVVKIGVFCYGLAMVSITRVAKVDDESVRMIYEVFTALLKDHLSMC